MGELIEYRVSSIEWMGGIPNSEIRIYSLTANHIVAARKSANTAPA